MTVEAPGFALKITIAVLGGLLIILLILAVIGACCLHFYRKRIYPYGQSMAASGKSIDLEDQSNWLQLPRPTIAGLAGEVDGKSGGSAKNVAFQTSRARQIQPVKKHANRRASVPVLPYTVMAYRQSKVAEHDVLNRDVLTKKMQISKEEEDFVLSPKENLDAAVTTHSTMGSRDNLNNNYSEDDLEGNASPPTRPRVARLSSFCPIGTEELHSDLYSDLEGCVPLNAYGLGLVCFSLHYSLDNETLTVTLHRACYLTSKRDKEKGTFYAKLRLHNKEVTSAASCASLDTLGLDVEHGMSKADSLEWSGECGTLGSKKKGQHVVEHHTEQKTVFRNADFEAAFAFKVGSADVAARVLQIVVKEAMGVFERNVLIGVVNFRLADANLVEGQESIEELWRDVVLPDKENLSQGEILLSMCYNPTKHRLAVGIISCRGLSVKEGAHGQIFVRVSFMSGETLVKSKETKRVSHDLVNPQFPPRGNTLQFKLDPCLVNSLSCVFFVCFKARVITNGQLLGKCVVGPVAFADGEGLEHWNQAIEDPGTEIIRWHNLI